MKKIKVYLDNCCFNRPFDDQSDFIVMLETEAKLYVQDMILAGELELAWSFVLDYENGANPFEERKSRISAWRELASVNTVLCKEITDVAEGLMCLGLRQKDASHIACAVYENADYFLTTDKKILNKPISNIKVVNPIDFTRRLLDEE